MSEEVCGEITPNKYKKMQKDEKWLLKDLKPAKKKKQKSKDVYKF